VPLAADTRDVYDGLARLYLPIAAAVFAIVMLLTLWYVVRGRRRAAAGGPEENNPLEIAYAIGLAAIVAVLVAATFHAQDRIVAHASGPPEQVQIVAAKWNWRFVHPRWRITEVGRNGAPAVLTVPAGRPVEFSGTSLDVLHAFWIPSLRFQRQLGPGKTTTFELTFAHPGFTSIAACSFCCGLGHAGMRFAVRVLPADRFDAWARSGGRG